MQAAKVEIKNTKIVKEGRNEFSKYDYFTPSQIEFLVAQACQNNGLITFFDLIRNELGVYGKLTIYDLETGSSLSREMATAIPEIKATNIAQQLGGCMTYTERYLKTSAFGITDNRLDFDTTENTKKGAETKKEPVKITPVDTKKIVFDYLSGNAKALAFYQGKQRFTTINELTSGQIEEIYEHLKVNDKL